MEDSTRFFTMLFANLVQIPTLVFMIIQLGKKYKDSLDHETRKRDPIRLLLLVQIILWFMSFLPSTIHRLVFLEDPPQQLANVTIGSVSLSSIVALGISLVAYVNRKEPWIYAGWFFYAGIVTYMLLTNNAATFYMLQMGFMIVGQITYVLFYFITGIKYRDDKIMGLGLFFLMPIISGMFSSNYILYAVVFGFLTVYGIPYATGKVRFFKRVTQIYPEASIA